MVVSRSAYRHSISGSFGNCDERRDEPRGGKNSRINACRLVGVPQVHPGPQCGPGNGYTGAFSGISSSFRGFCANGHVTSNTGTSSRFDVLLTATLTAAANSAGSTTAQLRNSQLFRKGENLKLWYSAEKMRMPTAQWIPRVSRCGPLCAGWLGGSPPGPSQKSKPRVEALWEVVRKGVISLRIAPASPKRIRRSSIRF